MRLPASHIIFYDKAGFPPSNPTRGAKGENDDAKDG